MKKIKYETDFTHDGYSHSTHYLYLNKDDEFICEYKLAHYDISDTLANVYVNEKYRGKGYFKMMMDDILKEQKIRINALVNVDIIELYERYGFKVSNDSEEEHLKWITKELFKNEKNQ